MTEVEQQPPPQNGIDLSAAEEDDSSKARPADIEQDMREMERRKRVEAIMGSKLFREELERIVDSARDGGGILQHLSDIMGVPTSTRVSNVFKATNCMLPINDIRGVESMGYAKGEKILRCKLAATFRLLDLYGWTQGLGAQITARLKVDQENFLVNPYGLMYHEITASSLNKVDMQGQVVEQGTTNFGVNRDHFALHSVVHAARPDIRCAIYIGCTPVVAVSSLKIGLLPLTRDACVLGEVTTHSYTGTQMDADERDRLVRALGPNSKVLILSNYGALCCGETIEEAFFAASHIVKACETQLQLLPVGVDNLVLIPEESRKVIFTEARRPPEDLEKKFAAAVATVEANAEAAAAAADGEAAVVAKTVTGGAPKWRVGGAEFEALMRMLDNAGYRTGYIYRHPLIKSDPPKPKNDVELPPAVSSLGYLLEEEELLKQGIWKKGDFRKGGDRSRWLNSPNVYQKVEVLETGTPDPKKITKWVAEGSPTHSTPVRIEDPLQFVPAGTNPKEFKRLQQQIKDNRRADKISAGPQSHILEGVTWDEANRIKDATVSSAGDHVVLMGAASKGIIQRGYQHNAAVYKAPYAKNPFDNVTDDELNEYKRTVERKKKSIHGEYTDTDFSESEPLSSMPISAPQQTKQTITTAAVSQSEPEDTSEHQVMRIQTQQAPVPSQPEVVLSDATLNFINGERSHTTVHRKPPTGRDIEEAVNYFEEEEHSSSPIYDKIIDKSHARKSSSPIGNNKANNQSLRDEANTSVATIESPKQQEHQSNKENIFCGNSNIERNTALIAELKEDALFQRQMHKLQPNKNESKECTVRQVNINDNSETRPISGGSDKSPGRFGDNGGERVCASPHNKSTLGGNKQQSSQLSNIDGEIGFRPIHPIEPRTDATETFTQRPHFCYADPNKNGDIGCQVAADTYTHNHHHWRHYAQHHRQHGGPAVGIVTLPHFEQAFGHLLSRPKNNLCAIYYDNYAASYEPVYDRTQYADATNNGSIITTTTDTDDAENPYRKSNACCTPAVCDSIFESLRKPTTNDNNLIFNIPFTAESPDTTIVSASTPRKTRVDLLQKSAANSVSGKGTGTGADTQPPTATSPYRTLSHFGFNSPQRDPQPDHKHIPGAAEQKKYVPLRKSISYEEIFSSPRYVDLCESCFERIVRLKPEIAQQAQMRLRNLCDLNGSGSAAGRAPGGTCTGIMYQPGSDSIAYDYVEYASSEPTDDEALPLFSSQLEPVLEVVEEVEPDSIEDARMTNKNKVPAMHVRMLERTASNSSFIEKINRLNYSEESVDWNFVHEPHKVASSTNLTLELERAIMENSQREQQQQPQQQQVDNEVKAEIAPNLESAVTAYVNAKDAASEAPPRVSVTEIWEFMKWQDDADVSQRQQHSSVTPFSQNNATITPQNGAICLYYENAQSPNNQDTFHNNTTQDHVNNQCNTSGASTEISATASDDSAKEDRNRSLMTRDERSRRKLVFQELWEDHIFFLDGKEFNTLSDTESAIDVQQEQRATCEQNLDGIVTDSDDGISVCVEQDVTDVLNEGNELLVMPTADGNVLPSVVAATIQSTASEPIQTEVFNSRSFILKYSASGTALQTCSDFDDELNKLTQSETVMKMRTTDVRQFSVNDLVNTRRDSEALPIEASLMQAANDVEDETPFRNESETRTPDECENIASSNQNSCPTVFLSTNQKNFETCERTSSTLQNAFTSVQVSLSNESSDSSTEANTSHTLTLSNNAPEDIPKCDQYERKACETILSFKQSVLTGEFTGPQQTSSEITLHAQSRQSFKNTDDGKQSISAKAAHITKSSGKSFIVTKPISNAANKQIPPESNVPKVDNDRPPTPKPPITKSKHSKLTTTEPQSTIQETEPKLSYKSASLGEQSTSESDDDQSARTYNVGSSQERLFFLEHQLDNTAADATPGRMYSESDEIYLTTNKPILEEGVNRSEPTVISEFKAPERAKAGMALPSDDQKPKTDHNTGTRSIANFARVAQMTAEALNEPSSKVNAIPRTTKRPRKKTNALPKSAKSVASTSAQAAQHKAEELNLMYEPKVEEFVLFKQRITSLTTHKNAVACDRDIADVSQTFDKGELEFAELLESDEHEDLTKLNEEFEELLLNVENLQLQKRHLGGAEIGVNEQAKLNDDNEIVDGADSHLNAMERKVLRKIRENQLNENDEIFDKIEVTIRNKITPSRIELLIKEQSLNMSQRTLEESKSSHNTFTASTPERFSSAHTTFGGDSLVESFVQHEYISDVHATYMEATAGALEPRHSSWRMDEVDANESSTLTPNDLCGYSRHSTGKCSPATTYLRRSRSLTSSTGNCELSPPPSKLNKTATPPQVSTRESQKSVTAHYKSKANRLPCASNSSPEIQPSKRNFILENIRNASIPRHSASGGGGVANSVKRLQGNAQAIFGKNPFGSVKAPYKCSKMLLSHVSNTSLNSSIASSSRTIVKSNSSSSQTIKKLSPRNSSTDVCTFQTKLVRGSPRFWVSLTQPTVKKLHTQMRRRRSQQQQQQQHHHHHRKMRIEAHDSTGSLRDYAELMDNEPAAQEDEDEEEEEAQKADVDENEYVHAKNVSHGEELNEARGTLEDEQTTFSVDLDGDVGTQPVTDEIAVDSGVDYALAALGEQIDQIQPRLDSYKRKMRDFGEHVAKCTRHMDDCIAVQGDIAEEQRQLREQITLQQYAEHILCQVQTYSISETED